MLASVSAGDAEIHVRESIGALRKHDGVAFLYQCTIAEPRVGTGQPGNSGKFTRKGKAGALEEATRNFTQRRCAVDTLGEVLRKAFFGKSPKIGESGLINHFG